MEMWIRDQTPFTIFYYLKKKFVFLGDFFFEWKNDWVDDGLMISITISSTSFMVMAVTTLAAFFGRRYAKALAADVTGSLIHLLRRRGMKIVAGRRR